MLHFTLKLSLVWLKLFKQFPKYICGDPLDVALQREINRFQNVEIESKKVKSYSPFNGLGTLPLKRELLAKARTSLSSEKKYILYNKENHRRSTSFCVSREIKKKC
jgi:hypothetical protein